MSEAWETVLVDCYGCRVNLTDRYRLERLVRAAAEESGVHPYSAETFWFAEQDWQDMYGMSAFCLIVPLRESHLVVHTFPAKEKAIIDLTTCGEAAKAKAAAHHLASVFHPARIVPHYIERCGE